MRKDVSVSSMHMMIINLPLTTCSTADTSMDLEAQDGESSRTDVIVSPAPADDF